MTPPLPACAARVESATGVHVCTKLRLIVIDSPPGTSPCRTCDLREGPPMGNPVLNCQHRRSVARPVMACTVFRILVPYPGFGESLCDRCQASPETLQDAPEVMAHYADPATFPTVGDPQERLRICQGCLHWRQRQKCAAWCSCKEHDRPDPLAEAGENCPHGIWRRP